MIIHKVSKSGEHYNSLTVDSFNMQGFFLNSQSANPLLRRSFEACRAPMTSSSENQVLRLVPKQIMKSTSISTCSLLVFQLVTQRSRQRKLYNQNPNRQNPSRKNLKKARKGKIKSIPSCIKLHWIKSVQVPRNKLGNTTIRVETRSMMVRLATMLTS